MWHSANEPPVGAQSELERRRQTLLAKQQYAPPFPSASVSRRVRSQPPDCDCVADGRGIQLVTRWASLRITRKPTARKSCQQTPSPSATRTPPPPPWRPEHQPGSPEHPIAVALFTWRSPLALPAGAAGGANQVSACAFTD